MATKKKLFPHIPRIISAVSLLAIVFSLMTGNYLALAPGQEPYLTEVISWVQQLVSPQVLGVTDAQKQQERYARSLQKFQSLKATLSQRPAYPDGSLQLGALAYELGFTTEAKGYLEEVIALDPNNEKAKMLLGSIE